MTAKEELMSISRMRHRINRIQNRVAEIRETMTSLRSPSGVMSPDKVQTSMDGDKLASLVAELDELENRYLDDMKELQRKITRITDRIDKMEDERYKQVLFSRYVIGETWEQIAVEMNFFIRHIYRLHGEALKEYAKTALNDSIQEC